MADYREISQEYAKEGIKAALLINAGAAVAMLTQTQNLIPNGLGDDAAIAMILWSIGVLLAAITWPLAFISTRYVDKAGDESQPGHIVVSNRYMFAGLTTLLLSLVFFIIGCVVISCAFLGFVNP